MFAQTKAIKKFCGAFLKATEGTGRVALYSAFLFGNFFFAPMPSKKKWAIDILLAKRFYRLVCANNTFYAKPPLCKGRCRGTRRRDCENKKTIPHPLKREPPLCEPPKFISFTSGNPVHKGALDSRIQTAHKSKFEIGRMVSSPTELVR